jgi:hypothetical protein
MVVDIGALLLVIGKLRNARLQKSETLRQCGVAKVRKEELLVGKKVAAAVERTMMCLLIQHDSNRRGRVCGASDYCVSTVVGYYHALRDCSNTCGLLVVT